MQIIRKIKGIKKACMVFINLEKAYDSVPWEVLQEPRSSGKEVCIAYIFEQLKICTEDYDLCENIR